MLSNDTIQYNNAVAAKCLKEESTSFEHLFFLL